MGNNKLGELVKMARGERSLREYSKDSGVDPAIISKIETGKYIPKKPKMLQDLTSEKAQPRGGVTFEQLLKEADYSKSYLAGMAAVSSMITAVGGVPVAALPFATLTAGAKGATVAKSGKKEENEDEDKLLKAINDIQRFAATSMGLVYSNMAAKGIVFRPMVKTEEEKKTIGLDTTVIIDGSEISEYVFSYIYLDEIDRKADVLVESSARKTVEKFVFMKSNSKRKVSLIVNCKELYDYLTKYKCELSYRGNLSVILVNIENVILEKEEYLAFYDEEQTEELLCVV